MSDDGGAVIPVGARLGSRRLFNAAAGDRPRAKPDTAPKAAGVVGDSSVTPARGRSTAVASTVLELAGITSVSAGCWLIAPYLGLIVLGLCMILLSVAMGRP